MDWGFVSGTGCRASTRAPAIRAHRRPGKRPLHNMCITVVLRAGKPVLALGGAGGVRIPNSIFDVLTRFAMLDQPMDKAVAAPRLHCMGMLDVEVTKDWPVNEAEYLRSVGFKVNQRHGHGQRGEF